MRSASEAGSFLRLTDVVYHPSLGLRVIKKKKKIRYVPALTVLYLEDIGQSRPSLDSGSGSRTDRAHLAAALANLAALAVGDLALTVLHVH